MAPEAQWTLPAATAGTNRTLYLFRGKAADIEGKAMTLNSMAQLRPDSDIVIRNGNQEAEFLLLQGKPIGEPVVQYGPFVMNSRAEIQQAFEDYQRTGFGGWPWPADDPVFPRSQGCPACEWRSNRSNRFRIRDRSTIGGLTDHRP